MNKDW